MPDLPQLPIIENALFIDNSSFERIVRCPRSAYFYILRKREANRPTSALSYGRNLHKALEVRYSDPDALQIPSPEVAAQQMETLREEFADYPTDDWRTFDQAVATIRAYNEEYPFEEFEVKTVVNPDGVRMPLVELPFAYPLFEMSLNRDVLDASGKPVHVDNLVIVWQGRIDLVVEKNGRLYLLDHKTTSMGGATYFKQFELSHQFYGYVYVAQKILKQPFAGFYVNALVGRKPIKTGRSIEFMRNLFDIDEAHLADWFRDTQSVLGQFVFNCLQSHFPKYTFNCVGKFGLCEYHDVCLQRTPEMAEILLQSGDFRDVDWDPLHDGPRTSARKDPGHEVRPDFVDSTIAHLIKMKEDKS